MLYEAIPTQDVTNAASVSSFCCMKDTNTYLILPSNLHIWIFRLHFSTTILNEFILPTVRNTRSEHLIIFNVAMHSCGKTLELISSFQRARRIIFCAHIYIFFVEVDSNRRMRMIFECCGHCHEDSKDIKSRGKHRVPING